MHIRNLQSALARREFRLDPRMAHLIFLKHGAAFLTASGRELAGGQMLWLAPGMSDTMRIEAGSGSVSLSIPQVGLARILAQGDGDTNMAALSRMSPTATPPRDRHHRLSMLFDTIAAETETPRPDSRMAMDASCTLLLIEFLRLVRPQVAETGRQLPLSERFMLLSAQHWHEHWTVETYANALGVTRFQLGEALRRHSGASPQQFLQAQIMEKAKVLLNDSPLRIAAIAYRLGFQDPAYFSRMFRRHVGQTPGAWRSARKGDNPNSFAAWP